MEPTVEPAYMGAFHREYCKLADAWLVLGQGGEQQRLPVHTSELARQSPLLLSAVVAHRELGA